MKAGDKIHYVREIIVKPTREQLMKSAQRFVYAEVVITLKEKA